jgi:hypothetical protein
LYGGGCGGGGLLLIGGLPGGSGGRVQDGVESDVEKFVA